MKYEKGEMNFKGLNFSWELTHTKKGERGENEVFKIQISNGDKTIFQEFNNSIMEKELSENIKLSKSKSYDCGFSVKDVRPKMWAGYDEDLNNKKMTLKEFDKKRIYWLLYGIINDFSGYIEIDYYSFKDFCDCFGYEENNRKHEEIYKSCLKYYDAIQTLNLNQEQREYFLNVVRAEEEDFNKLIKSEIQTQY